MTNATHTTEPTEKLDIWVRPTDGAAFRAFTYTRGAHAGIVRARQDAEHFGVEITAAWAMPAGATEDEALLAEPTRAYSEPLIPNGAWVAR